MDKSHELITLSDELYDLICLIEICRGYTQADVPDMVSFDIVLANMHRRFVELYDRYSEAIKEVGRA